MCILLVEDEWLIRTMVAEELMEGGFAVCEIEDGDQGHCQLVGLRSRWRATRTACSWLRRSGDAGDLGLNLEGLGLGGSILSDGHLAAAKAEGVVDPVVGGQEELRLPG